MVGPEFWPDIPPELQMIDAQLTQELNQLQPISAGLLSPAQREAFDLASQSMTVERSGRSSNKADDTIRTHRKRGFLALHDNYMPRVVYRMLDSGLIDYEPDEAFPSQDEAEFTPLGAILLKGTILKVDREQLVKSAGTTHGALKRTVLPQLQSFLGVKRANGFVRRAYEIGLFLPQGGMKEAAEQEREQTFLPTR